MATLNNFPSPVRSRGPSMLETYLTIKQSQQQDDINKANLESAKQNQEIAANQEARAAETFNRNKTAVDSEAIKTESNQFMQDPQVLSGLERIANGGGGSADYIKYIQTAYPSLAAQGSPDLNGDGELDAEEAAASLKMLNEARAKIPQPKTKPTIVGEGATAIDTDTGEVIYKNEKDEKPPPDYTIGDTRYSGATNKPIAQNKTQSGDQRDRKIADLMRTADMSESDAIALVDGHKRIEVNDKTGRVQLIDERTNEVQEITLDVPEATPGIEDNRPGLYEMAELATGVGSGLRSVWNMTPLGNMSPATQTEYARTQVKTSTQALIRSLVNNPRYAVGEQDRIREQLDINPSVFTTPSAMRTRMVSVSDYLKDELKASLDIVNNPGANDEMRANALRASNDIQNYIAKLKLPPVVGSESEYKALEKGTIFINRGTGELRRKP